MYPRPHVSEYIIIHRLSSSPLLSVPYLICFLTYTLLLLVKMLPLTTLLPLLALVAASPIAKRANNQLIVSSRDGQCLSPQDGAAAVSSGSVTNGTPLVSMDCAKAAGWDLSPGSGSVILSGTGYAMDAGTKPKDNGQLKVSSDFKGRLD